MHVDKETCRYTDRHGDSVASTAEILGAKHVQYLSRRNDVLWCSEILFWGVAPMGFHTTVVSTHRGVRCCNCLGFGRRADSFSVKGVVANVPDLFWHAFHLMFRGQQQIKTIRVYGDHCCCHHLESHRCLRRWADSCLFSRCDLIVQFQFSLWCFNVWFPHAFLCGCTWRSIIIIRAQSFASIPEMVLLMGLTLSKLIDGNIVKAKDRPLILSLHHVSEPAASRARTAAWQRSGSRRWSAIQPSCGRWRECEGNADADAVDVCWHSICPQLSLFVLDTYSLVFKIRWYECLILFLGFTLTGKDRCACACGCMLRCVCWSMDLVSYFDRCRCKATVVDDEISANLRCIWTCMWVFASQQIVLCPAFVPTNRLSFLVIQLLFAFDCFCCHQFLPFAYVYRFVLFSGVL